ncbi:hypothetical protein ECANGB1_1360 [Enterospora canceri]|uniref:Uncharacterized protein n=1 Tax=Enterospora canceri TaxID=1081671 RepID=A0A1Y1S6X9_9MICR|nr:hypothetical protein ECANGB1_1360 [Enterospora canceri]
MNNEMNMQIKSHLYNKSLSLMFDGSCKADLHYINIMAGDIEDPSKKYLINQNLLMLRRKYQTERHITPN